MTKAVDRCGAFLLLAAVVFCASMQGAVARCGPAAPSNFWISQDTTINGNRKVCNYRYNTESCDSGLSECGCSSQGASINGVMLIPACCCSASGGSGGNDNYNDNTGDTWTSSPPPPPPTRAPGTSPSPRETNLGGSGDAGTALPAPLLMALSSLLAAAALLRLAGGWA